MSNTLGTALTDQFGRTIDYVRLSVTDRCDFRCVYCMAEDMQFLPRKDILSLEELAEVGHAFIELGVNTIRITGGEPLVRSNLPWLISTLRSNPQLKELNLSTNGSRLAQFAEQLRASGLDRINISLDTLNPQQFNELTRTGKLSSVLEGIALAKQVGFKRIKLNAVILKGRNDNQVIPLVEFAINQQIDISFIEEMPLGAINEHGRELTFFSSDELRAVIEQQFTLLPCTETGPGPSRYFNIVGGNKTRIGLISPHSHNFCGSCNRVRVTVEGQLLLCLGNEHSYNLKTILRDSKYHRDHLKAAIINSIQKKPERHYFAVGDNSPEIIRFMNATGG